ncbi:MAG: hypothetical protein J2P54_22470 [Bradyrhizobiaceae bacterium]|nr:hypothetical protein [Bradyrhizobiaceae bacterium]
MSVRLGDGGHPPIRVAQRVVPRPVAGGGQRVRIFDLSSDVVRVGPYGAVPEPPPPPPPAPERCHTLAEFRWALAQRLYEATQAPAPMQFWNPEELDVYIREALQTFNACAYYFRQEFTFSTVAGQPWYDITKEPRSLRPLTTVDFDLISQIEYHLLEPQTPEYPLHWRGSKQFDLDDILRAIEQSRDQTLSESGCTVNQSLVPAVPGRTYLDASVMDIRRLSWIPNRYQRQFTPNVVMPSDLWATQSFNALFPQRGPGTPLLYRRTSSPPFSFDVDIEPAVNGDWDILTTNTNGRLSREAFKLIPVPDDWCHVVKYGALAQLFGRESCAKDTLREDYALKRWKQGLAMMQTAPALLAARIDNVPVIVDAMSNGDFYDANWQGKKHARPKKIYYSGLNMLGLSPIPDRVYSVTAPVICNMPLPYDEEDCIEVGRDDFFAILDLAQHIAMLKLGGAEFQATFPLYANFLRHCALYNSKLNAMSLWREWMDQRPQEEIKVNPIFSPTADPVKLQNGGASGG